MGHEIRVVSTPDERAVVVRLRLGRCLLPVQIVALPPVWVPLVRLPECLMLDRPSYLELDAAVRTAFDVYRANFLGGADNEPAASADEPQARDRRRV